LRRSFSARFAAFVFCALCSFAGSVSAAPRYPPHGPGIAICEPVTSPADAAQASFGSGCAAWLQLAVGGQPQLGQTPLWSALNRARTEMNRPDLQLSAAQAVGLASKLGVTHVAAGTLRGAGPRLSLTFRLLQVPQKRLVGPPVTLAGTQTQIVAGLPQMARTLAKRLGVAAPRIPSSAGLTPAECRLLGLVRWQKTLTGTQQAALDAAAAHSPLAGLIRLNLARGRTHAHFNRAVRVLLAQAGGNPLVWGEIGGQKDSALLPDAFQLSAFAARYPGSYNLAVAETSCFRAAGDRPAELQAAARVIQDAPRNPDGWLTYAETVSSAASDVRQGRVYDALSPEESRRLSRLYPKCEAAAARAVQLDPDFAHAWERLAQAATFTSDTAVADHALQTALALGDDKAGVYVWALEMYQPKWGGDPAKLSRFTQLAASDTTLDIAGILSVSRELYDSGSPDLYKKMLGDFITRRRAFLSDHPSDGEAHEDVAEALGFLGSEPEALAEYQTAATLLPDDAVAQFGLGNALYQLGDSSGKSERYTQALAQLQNAVRLDLDYADAYSDIAYCQKDLGHYDEAKSAARTVLHLDPASGDAYAVLAEVALRENNSVEAALLYQTAIRLGPFRRSDYQNLITALANTKQWDTLLAVGAKVEGMYQQQDGATYNDMANASLEKKDWANALAFSQAALAVNADDPWAHENLAEAYLGAGHIPEAQAEWRKVLTYKDDQFKAVAEGYLKTYP